MIPVSLAAWALRHNVSAQAMHELAYQLGMVLPPPAPADGLGEAWAQSAVRLEAPKKGCKLFRNNVGVLNDRTGRPVRYGLANESKAMNETVKSADLIGWRPVTITPAYVGQVIAQFLSREIKEPGWTYKGTPREVAQANWAHLVIASGGDAAFATGPGTL